MKNFSDILLSCLISSVFMLSLVNASGFYLNAIRNREDIKITNYFKVSNDQLKTLSYLDEGSDEDEMAEKPGNETNPIKTNGAVLPPIAEDPHLDEIDEEYSKCNGVDIRELTISQIQELFRENKLTSVDLTKCYIERIEKLNPVMRAVNEINPDALNQAAKADIERKLLGSGDNLGMMHGIPVLLKENIATNDRMETTAGSLALVGIRPKSDADVVKTLRKSGAVILGKANLSEFAFFRGTNIPSGWSGRGNQTRNPYNLNVTPEGSSSGSAVTVAANLAVVSIGTETDGSLIAPSNCAGIFTIKPTHGIPSIKGIIPISHNQDHAGPMARTVTDLSILLDAMISDEERHSSHPKSFTECLKQNKNSRPFRIGIMRQPFFNTSIINSTNLEAHLPQLDELINTLKNSIEFEILDPLSPEISLLKNISGERELTVLTHDFKHDFNEYLRSEVIGPYPLPSKNPSAKSLTPEAVPSKPSISVPLRKIASLKDVIQFNEDNPSPEGYNQELLVMSEATDGLTNETYIKYRDTNRNTAKEVLDSVLKTHNLDAVLSPSESRYDGVIDQDFKDTPVVAYSLAAISGYPSINVPAGVGTKDVPFGITLTGMPYSEAVLLQIGYAIERLSPQRTRPKFLV